MKHRIGKWVLRLGFTAILVVAVLIIIVLNPLLTYGNSTRYGNYTIYHNQRTDDALLLRIDETTSLLKTSECYNPALRLDICLNDGSVYPFLMQRIRGSAFGWGFYNKVVIMGKVNCKENYVELNGYKWNFTQLLAHEAMHCLQYDKLGLWGSAPVANIAIWKWEGYPEYVARQGVGQRDLRKNIDRLLETERTNNNRWIQFGDGTGTVITYYESWLLVQYCMGNKRMTWQQVLKDTAKEETVRKEMMRWYGEQR